MKIINSVSCLFRATLIATALHVFIGTAYADEKPVAAHPVQTLFANVRVFDGIDSKLSNVTNVLVKGNKITTISSAAIVATPEMTVIDGKGRTLMPGLIDMHTHMMFAAVPESAALVADIGYLNVLAVKSAGDMLLRGFTSEREAGGPVFGLKRAIDSGIVPGPRIWPSGAFVSQSGGHGDDRLPSEFPVPPNSYSAFERNGLSIIADNPDEVRKRVRENLALGASQIKMLAGGGVASNYDPLDVTEFTVEELRAGVQAAENWGTYVMVHAYTPRAVRQAIEAGVKCIEHGQLLDDATAKLMAEKGIWWDLQPFLDDEDAIYFAPGTINRQKYIELTAGTDNAYKLAKKYHVKTAFGTDTLFDPKLADKQGKQLAKLTRWYTPAEVLKMATSDNASLLALSGNRNPYPGKLGVVQEGALADLLLVDGDPIENIKLIEDPHKNFLVIMKDGHVVKNITR
ncbi:amidohydrolase family protein [Undibacterium sp. SXout11W]|uniref:metal-dependent hydrolase family protein n=1 Tax=Undibacterium sp. SXout11W TaxID=3413050 RepID=UPI003BF00421